MLEDVDNLNSRGGSPNLPEPHEWRPDGAFSQLVACVERRWDSDQPSRTITCDFELGSPIAYDIVEGDYKVTVREARTGKTIGEFTVAADQSDDDTCPSSVIYRTDGTPHGQAILRGANTEQFIQRLRPYVFDQR